MQQGSPVLADLAAAARILGARIVVVDPEQGTPVAVIDGDGTMERTQA